MFVKRWHSMYNLFLTVQSSSERFKKKKRDVFLVILLLYKRHSSLCQLYFIYTYKSECMFVAVLPGMFLGMYTINSLTP
jgi:hypothetical protein